MAKNKPSLLNSAIAWISPQRACEREAWRQQYELMKGYDAAGNGRLNANWRARNEAAEYTDRMSRDTIRARARDLERNSDMAGGILSAGDGKNRAASGQGTSRRADYPAVQPGGNEGKARARLPKRRVRGGVGHAVGAQPRFGRGSREAY